MAEVAPDHDGLRRRTRHRSPPQHDLAGVLEATDDEDDLLLGLLDLAEQDGTEQVDVLEQGRGGALGHVRVTLIRTSSVTPLRATARSALSTWRSTCCTSRSSSRVMSSNMNIRLLTSSASSGSRSWRPSTMSRSVAGRSG